MNQLWMKALVLSEALLKFGTWCMISFGPPLSRSDTYAVAESLSSDS